MRRALSLLVLLPWSACQAPGPGGQDPAPGTVLLQALAGPPSCEQTEGPVGFPAFGCEGLSEDPCVVVGCFDGVCRQGKLFAGCCATDQACDEPSKLTVCNGFQGRCQLFDGQGVGRCDYDPDALHPGCCLTSHDCGLELLAGKVLASTGRACAADAECADAGPQGGACRGGACVPRCDGSACVPVPCNAEGLAIRTYPAYGASCDHGETRDPDGVPASGDEWSACSFVPIPGDDCRPDADALSPPVRLSELMVAPQAVDDALGEWIELVNTSDRPINLAGWFVGAGAGPAPPGDAQRLAATDACARIEPNGTFVVCRGSADPAVNGSVPCDAVMASPDAWSLPDEGGAIALWGPGPEAPELVDSIQYAADQVVPGVSLALSHPYAAHWNGPGARWITQGGLARLACNEADHGTPGSLNLDVTDFAFDADPRAQVFCADLDPCTLDLCAPSAPNGCEHHALACGEAPGCETDADCTGTYPLDLDLAVDLAEPFGVLDTADADAVRARFDEVMSKRCVQHACQYRKRPDAPRGCVAADYGRPDLDCDDRNPCTRDRCACNADDPFLCADGDPSNGYFACDASEPVVPGEVCCRADADCPDDGDPATVEACHQYRCERSPRACWCTGPEDCTAATVCEVAGCMGCAACTYQPDPAKPGCCASHAECRLREAAREGRDVATTLDVCCRDAGHAVDDDPALNGLCEGLGAGAGYPRCVAALAPGTCDRPSDCELPVGQRCLTPQCVAHRCHAGPPAADGDPGTPGVQACCDRDAGATGDDGACDDGDPCTLDTCVDAGAAPLGACVHGPDPARPGCCSGDADCGADDPCVRAACRVHGVIAYPTCAVLDLGALGLCCTTDADCDDADACTVQWCIDHLCRAWKPDPACCQTKLDCPPARDACATGECAAGACALAPVADCVANLPYRQDFEFGAPFYDAALVAPDLVGWEVSGTEPEAWTVTDAPEGGTSWSRHLRFAPGADAGPGEPACVQLPGLNTSGMQNAGLGLVFRHALYAGGDPPDLVLTAEARNRVTEDWEPLWTLDTPGDGAAREVEVLVPPDTPERAFLGVPRTGLRFCLAGPSFAAGVAWVLDDVGVARGRPPSVAVLPGALVLAPGADARLATLQATDPDADPVGFALSGAPAFVSLVAAGSFVEGGVPVTVVDVRARDVACDGIGATAGVFPFRVRVSGGGLFSDVSLVLTVQGCAPLP